QYPPHPCTDVFPMMTDVELDDLARDIQQHGLREPVTLWHDGTRRYLLDGRNRVEALTRAEIDLDHPPYPIFKTTDVADPAALVISLNIHRRHLTKEQKAELIVKVAQAQQENDSAKLARSFSPKSGRRGGSTKDPVLEQAKTMAQEHGISARTTERAYAKLQNKPTQRRKPARAQPEPPVMPPPAAGGPPVMMPAAASTPRVEEVDPKPDRPANLHDLTAAFVADVERLVDEMLDIGHPRGVAETLKDIKCLVNGVLDRLLVRCRNVSTD